LESVYAVLSLDRIQTMTVPLPRGRENGPDDPTMVFLQTSEGDALYWKQGNDGTPELITTTELPARLAEYKNRVPAPKVLVRGDNKAKFGRAVAVLDEVREAGISQVSIETLTSHTGN
jgi:biopolymer transport protein ExbD